MMRTDCNSWLLTPPLWVGGADDPWVVPLLDEDLTEDDRPPESRHGREINLKKR